MAISALSKVSDRVNASAGVIRDNATKTSEQSENMSGAADQATRNVVTVASAAEELSAPGQEVTRIVDENKSISEAAVLEARKANEGVQNLEDATERIGETIENMASSTTEISEAASQQEQARQEIASLFQRFMDEIRAVERVAAGEKTERMTDRAA